MVIFIAMNLLPKTELSIVFCCLEYHAIGALFDMNRNPVVDCLVTWQFAWEALHQKETITGLPRGSGIVGGAHWEIRTLPCVLTVFLARSSSGTSEVWEAPPNSWRCAVVLALFLWCVDPPQHHTFGPHSTSTSIYRTDRQTLIRLTYCRAIRSTST